jgi:hypothetical protein
MMYQSVLPPRQSLPIRPIVLLLHPPSQAAVAGELVRVWQPSIPAAVVLTVSVVEGRPADLSDLPAALLAGSSVGKRPLILAGICGAEDAALRLGFDRRLPQCVGILVTGRVMPPLGPLAEQTASQVRRLRLVWEVSGSKNWAIALGELLSWYHAVGLDAQGAVLEPVGNTSTGEDGFSPALVHMGRIYLVELVATAMGGQSQPLFPQAVARHRRNYVCSRRGAQHLQNEKAFRSEDHRRRLQLREKDH